MYKYIIIGVACGLAAGLVGGFFLEKFFKSLKDNRILKCSEMLEKTFGEPMFANKFTLAEAQEWFIARQEKIKDGYKGVLMKVNKETFAKIGSTIEVDNGLENYILLAIYKDGNFLYTLLVKYVSLSDDIENALKPGIMVIE